MAQNPVQSLSSKGPNRVGPSARASMGQNSTGETTSAGFCVCLCVLSRAHSFPCTVSCRLAGKKKKKKKRKKKEKRKHDTFNRTIYFAVVTRGSYNKRYTEKRNQEQSGKLSIYLFFFNLAFIILFSSVSLQRDSVAQR